jgi:lysophospholipase L1-like esterase
MKTPLLCALLLLTTSAAFAEATVVRVDEAPKNLRPLAADVHGRVQMTDRYSWKYQWPGTMAELRISGTELFMKLGPEPVILTVIDNGETLATLIKPQPGFYRIGDLARGEHLVRIFSASENQAGPITFGGFFAQSATRQLPVAPRTRQIEFIGDSHTVGYGNTSGKRDCTEDEVWSTTNTARAFGSLVANHYIAELQVNAISGRGVVRNYGGFKADPLPVVYPYVLFDKTTPYKDPNWKPQVIVISLGTNDFSTELSAGEPWRTRDELHAAYEATYLQFLKTLRQRNPRALIVLWATDMANGEIQAEVKKVADAFASGGDRQIIFLPVNGLSFAACNWHPSAEDDQTIADALIKIIDAHAKSLTPAWPTPRH